ncbi:single-stranded DNA-binding protein [Agromyces lapidis]|uniref:Single-stranded DNA-binding protein n=1 Tax=Agromyces lapidis TaxID=279574 RepID=A0ABV5SPR2_9MICO|nr:single-stranded DNA-binding protein [Agromyces lapidis]
MSDTITVTGVVGTDPHQHVTGDGLVITSFRVASTRRFFDRAKGEWTDGETNWYGVSAFRQLARNASLSIRKGERVIVQGRLRQRAWETATKSGTSVEIEADAIGHDLAWCVSTYAKVQSARPAQADGNGDGTVEAEAASSDATSREAGAFDGADASGAADWSLLEASMADEGDHEASDLDAFAAAERD